MDAGEIRELLEQVRDGHLSRRRFIERMARVGIVAPMAAEEPKPSWALLLALAAIGGGPTVVGTFVGHGFTSEAVSVAFLTLAAGSIIYVVVQLLGVATAARRMDVLCWGLLLGLLAGFATDAIVTAGGV